MHASAGGTPTANTTAFRPDTQPSRPARIERNPITGTLNKTALTTFVRIMSGTPKETNRSRTVRGFGFGSGTASVAPEPQSPVLRLGEIEG